MFSGMLAGEDRTDFKNRDISTVRMHGKIGHLFVQFRKRVGFYSYINTLGLAGSGGRCLGVVMRILRIKDIFEMGECEIYRAIKITGSYKAHGELHGLGKAIRSTVAVGYM